MATFSPNLEAIIQTSSGILSTVIPPLWAISLSFLDDSKCSVSAVWQFHFDHMDSDSDFIYHA